MLPDLGKLPRHEFCSRSLKEGLKYGAASDTER